MAHPENESKEYDKQASTEDARRSFGDLVNRVGFGGERIVITRHGKPIAALVSMKDFDTLAPTTDHEVAGV